MRDEFEAKEFFDLKDFAHKELFREGEEVWKVLLRIESYLKQIKLGKIEGVVEEGAILVNPELIVIGKGSVVEAGAYIKGPCIIGKKCEVRHGAYVRGSVITGDECIIGHATEVKNALMLDGAKAGHFAYIGDSILGNDVNLGAGVKCANLRLDKQEVSISHEGKKIKSGLKKFGAVIGDGAQIGCNAVTNPGTLLKKNCVIFPCLNVGGVLS